jgi:hypothetical protein
MKEIFEKEIPYQVLSVVIALELLTLAALSPRTTGLEPLGFHAIGCLRFVGLLILAALLHEAKPRDAILAVSLWAVILAPPELWAFSIEAREGLPTSLISSYVIALGAYAFARLLPSAAQIFPALGVLALFFNGFQPSVYSVPMLLLLGSGLICLGLLPILIKPLRQGVSL